MERHLVGPDCREQYFADTAMARRVLRAHGIRSGGLSALVPPYRVERFPSPEHVLLLTNEGAGHLTYGGETVSLLPGSLCFLPAGSTYEYWTDSHWSKTWFHLTAIESGIRPVAGVTMRQVGAWDELTALGRLFLAERARANEDTFAVLDSLTRTISLLIRRELDVAESSPAAENRRRAERLRQNLYLEPGRDWTVSELAKEFGASPRHLQTVIKELYGCGAMEMVTRVRLERAATLLSTTNWKVEDVAMRVGYQNAFAFSRVFRRHMQQSPREYRQLYGIARAEQ